VKTRTDRRTVVLGIAAAGAVAAAVVVTISHHSTGSRERRDVTSYIEQVNALQTQMQAPLTRVMLAYASFTRKRSKRPSPTQLAAAAATLHRLDQRLAALPFPPEAKRLRVRLLALVHREVGITGEVQLLAAFAPRYVSTLGGVRAASLKLDSSLKTIEVPVPRTLRGTKQEVEREQRDFQAKAQQAAVAQATAIDAYDRAVKQVLRRLVRLRPPPALTPEYRAQVAALRNTAAAGAALARRLRAADRADVATLSRRFALASRGAGTRAVQRAQIAAIRGYDKRVRQVGSAAAAVQAELARLQRDLP
jgi:hypothetical protein